MEEINSNQNIDGFFDQYFFFVSYHLMAWIRITCKSIAICNKYKSMIIGDNNIRDKVKTREKASQETSWSLVRRVEILQSYSVANIILICREATLHLDLKEHKVGGAMKMAMELTIDLSCMESTIDLSCMELTIDLSCISAHHSQGSTKNEK